MNIETNGHQSLSERARLGVAPSRRSDVGVWHSPEVSRDVLVETSDAYQTPEQMRQKIAQEHQSRLLDPHGAAINRLGAAAGRRAGVYDQERDLMTISDKKPQHAAKPPQL